VKVKVVVVERPSWSYSTKSGRVLSNELFVRACTSLLMVEEGISEVELLMVEEAIS